MWNRSRSNKDKTTWRRVLICLGFMENGPSVWCLFQAFQDFGGRADVGHMSVQLKKLTHIASISASIFIITFLSSFMRSSPPTCGRGSSSPLLAAHQRVYAGAALFMQNVWFYLCFLLLALCLATISHIILLAWEALPFPCQPHTHTLSKHLHAENFISK